MRTGFWWGNLGEKGYLKDSDVDGRIILKRIFRNWNWGTWTRLIWLKIVIVAWHL